MAGANGGIIGPCVVRNTPVSAKVSTFNSTGTLTAQATATVDYLVVGGGGGGGGLIGGGGGAGGYRTSFGDDCVSGKPVTKGTSYTMTVGGGGAKTNCANSCAATSGTASSAFTCTPIEVESAGGGGGGNAPAGASGGAGGSGIVIIRYKFQ